MFRPPDDTDKIVAPARPAGIGPSQRGCTVEKVGTDEKIYPLVKIALVVDHYIPQPDQDAGSRTMIAIIECLLHAGYVVKFWPDNLAYESGYAEALQRFPSLMVTW